MNEVLNVVIKARTRNVRLWRFAVRCHMPHRVLLWLVGRIRVEWSTDGKHWRKVHF